MEGVRVEQMEFAAVAMDCDGSVYAGGPRQVMMTADQLTWYQWASPLAKVAALDVKNGLLAMAGDGQLAVTMTRHGGRLWQVVDVGGEPTCLFVSHDRVFVGTAEGRLFEFKVKVPRGLLSRLGLWLQAPAIMSKDEHTFESHPVSVDAINWCGGDD